MTNLRRLPFILLILTLSAAVCASCSVTGNKDDAEPHTYGLEQIVEVDGRQGVCYEDGYYWVSGSKKLIKYDSEWNIVAVNDTPFEGYETEVNHIGDIDVYKNELYIGAEYFKDGVGKNIRIAVYDGDTLELVRDFAFEEASGQLECSGIAVDAKSRSVFMCSWVGGDSGRYIYIYDLDTGSYLGKVEMKLKRNDGTDDWDDEDSDEVTAPKWIQGIACYDGYIYMTSDDGDADKDQPDHLYRMSIDGILKDRTGNGEVITKTVTLEKVFNDVTRQGEIEGLTFDADNGRLIVLYNRGARIVQGMKKGFYDGYDREISEVFIYSVK